MPFLGRTPTQFVDPEVDIDGGSIDGTAIGASSAAAGTFTNLTATGTLTFPDDGISGDDISGGTATLDGLTVDTNTLVVDSTNNRVGIGVSSGFTNSLNFPNAASIGFQDTGGAFRNSMQFNASNELQIGAAGAGISAITLGPNGSEWVTVYSSGNVGIGTTSPAAVLDVSKNLDGEKVLAKFQNRQNSSVNTASSISIVADQAEARIRVDRDGAGNGASLVFGTTNAGTLGDRVTINPSGNVGIGTTSPSNRLHVEDAAAYQLTLKHPSGNAAEIGIGSTDEWLFTSNSTERMRLTSSGNLLVGRSSTSASATDYGLEMYSSGGCNQYVNASGSTGAHNWYNNAGTLIAKITGNGGFSNYQTNDVNLSDERSKKDIVDSDNYLSKLCQIPVRNFRYNHDEDDGKHHLGVIAQEVEAVCPELVQKSAWKYEGEQMDAVYSTDLTFAMMKAIQEQQAIIEDLQTRLTALEAN